MPRQRNPLREVARTLWEASGRTRLLKDIAAEIGVKENLVRKWKSEDKWESERSDSTGKPEKERSDSEKARAKPRPKKRMGPPIGNRNAVGNRGGPGNPAPKGNKYAVVTGEFETLDYEGLKEEEARMRDALSYGPKETTLDVCSSLLVRKGLMLKRLLAAVKASEKGMVPHSVTVETTPANQDGKRKAASRRTSTAHENADARILRIENAILNIDKQILRAMEDVHRFDIDWEKLEQEQQKILLQSGKDPEGGPDDDSDGMTIMLDWGDEEDA